MPTASWQKLRTIQSHLEKEFQKHDAPRQKIALGMVLARAIDAYDTSLSMPKIAKVNRRGASATSKQPDLLEPLPRLEPAGKAR